jgi:hypothetical protein
MSAVEISVGQLGIRYLIDGSQTASLGMFELTVPPASNVPPPHSHSNNALIVLSPDIGAQYFKDVAAVVNAGGPPDKGALVAVMSRYGLVPSAPK